MKPLRLAVLALAGAALLFAQANPRLTASIPFDFEMANQKFAAGEYQVIDHSLHAYIFVQNNEDNRSAMLIGNTIKIGDVEPKDARLVFNKYGDRYFLSEVWHPAISRQLLKSRNEKALVTSTLITAAKPERIVIMARAY